MRRSLTVVLLSAAMLFLSACAPVQSLLDTLAPEAETVSIPGKMVVQIDVSTTPFDEALSRCYTDQDHMSAVLRMLRNMATLEPPEEEIQIDSYSKFYTVTATYVGGDLTVYHILDGKYLRSEGEDWCIIDAAKYNEFDQYIKTNLTGEAAETAPSESTQEPEPTESTASTEPQS